MDEFYTILTNLGLSAEAAAMETGVPVQIAQMAVGDSAGAYYPPDPEQTELVNEVWRGNLNSLTVDPVESNQFLAEALIPPEAGPFWVREVGLFTSTGVLYAVGKFPATYKPELQAGSGKELRVVMGFAVTNAAAIELIYAPRTVAVGTVTTGAPESEVSVTNRGTASAAILDFSIPRGANLSAGTVTTGIPGSDAEAAMDTDENGDKVLNLTIPRGSTVGIGTVTTGNPGTNAAVANGGSGGDVVLNFAIPSGVTGNPYRSYATLALANADLANIPANSLIWINGDTAAANNGYWAKIGGVLVQSPNDRITALENESAAVPGRNLFNKNESIITGKYIGYQEITEENAAITDFIKVMPNKQYTLSGRSNLANDSMVLFYTATKSKISFSNSYYNAQAFTTPANCKYIKFAVSRHGSTYDTIQLEPGAVASAFRPYVPIQEYVFSEMYSELQMVKTAGNNLINIFKDVLWGYGLHDTNGVLTGPAGAGQTVLRPIAVTPGAIYTLSNRKFTWQAGNIITFINYTGTTPDVLSDVVANSTVIAWYKKLNGIFTVPVGANYVLIGANYYYAMTVSDIQAASPDIKFELGASATPDSIAIKTQKYMAQDALGNVAELPMYRNMNFNFGLAYLSGVEEADFNRFNEYRSANSRTYYDFLKPEDDPYLVSLGIVNQIGFYSSDDWFLSVVDEITHYRRLGVYFKLPRTLKLNYVGHNYFEALFFVKTDVLSGDIAYFGSIASTNYAMSLVKTTGDIYSPSGTDACSVSIPYIAETYVETDMIVGKTYAYNNLHFITKIKDGLYQWHAYMYEYTGASSTVNITHVMIGRFTNLPMIGKFVLSGFYFYQKQLFENYIPTKPSHQPPFITAPIYQGLSLIATKEQANANEILKIKQGGWKGRKIVWLGTSVPNEPPFGEGGTKKYPEFVGQILGAKIYVKAVGGSIVAFDPPNFRYGFAGTTADYVAAGRTQSVPQISFETLLSGMWDAELFVFDHGHNDAGLFNGWIASSTLGTLVPIDETNQFDKRWMVGGLNYVIREIYKRNPRAKIAIINDYRAEFYWNKPANQLVADWWGLPILNPRMGAKNLDIVLDADTTYKKYNGTTGILSAGVTINPLKFVTKAALDDTTPAPSDTIHLGRYGRIAFAKRVAKWIINEIDFADTTGFY